MVETFFYFLLYAFGGWMLENMYSWKTTGLFLKENFLKSPVKPMYGVALVLLIYGEKFFHSSFVIIILCFLIPTIVEYVTGAFLEKYFGGKWWDYSDINFQLHGHVCLYFSLCWMVLSMGVLFFLHPMIVKLYNHLPMLHWVTPVLMSLTGVDMLATSFKRKRIRAMLIVDDK